MASFHFNFFHTIRSKLMAALFLVLTVSIGTAVFGIWTYEKDNSTASTQSERHGGPVKS